MDFRLDIDKEYQGWILAASSLTAFWILLLPCICAGCSWDWARRWASRTSKHLPLFLMVAFFFDCVFLFLITEWLPDYSPASFVKEMGKAAKFVAPNVQPIAESIFLIIGFILAFLNKDRIALVLGLDHVTIFKLSLRDLLYCCWGESRFK